MKPTSGQVTGPARAGDGSGPGSSQVRWSGQAGDLVRQVFGSGQAGGQGHFGTLEVPKWTLEVPKSPRYISKILL